MDNNNADTGTIRPFRITRKSRSPAFQDNQR